LTGLDYVEVVDLERFLVVHHYESVLLELQDRLDFQDLCTLDNAGVDIVHLAFVPVHESEFLLLVIEGHVNVFV